MSLISRRYSAANVASDKKEALSESRGDNAESSPDGTAELALSKGRAWTTRCTALLIVALAGLSAVVVGAVQYKYGNIFEDAGRSSNTICFISRMRRWDWTSGSSSSPSRSDCWGAARSEIVGTRRRKIA